MEEQPSQRRQRVSLQLLRAQMAELDPDLVVAADEVDRSLIAFALERSPLERVAFAQQLLETLLRFHHATQG